MADGFTATLDTRGLLDAFDKLGAQLLPALKAVAFETATAVQREARARVARRTGQTADDIVLYEDYTGHGYIVQTTDVRAYGSKATPGSKRKLSAHLNVPHVGLYLEGGTVHMSARPFFWPSVALQQGAFDRNVRQAVQDTIDEVGLGS